MLKILMSYLALFAYYINRAINVFASLAKLSGSQRRLKMKHWITLEILKSIKTNVTLNSFYLW